MPTCSNDCAVSERRGSTTTTRPPRVTTDFKASRISGSLHSDPCDTKGLAPIMMAKSVRQKSGLGRTPGPNSKSHAFPAAAASSELML